jgi:hypothetical protein
MQFEDFARRPFVIEAVQITEDNIHDVCALIGHDVLTEDGRTFIVVNKRIVPQGRRAQIGWWVTRRDEEYRTYSEGSFRNQFIRTDVEEVAEALALFNRHAVARVPVSVVNPEATPWLTEEDLDAPGDREVIITNGEVIQIDLDPTMNPEPGGPGSIEGHTDLSEIPSNPTVPDIAGRDISTTEPEQFHGDTDTMEAEA